MPIKQNGGIFGRNPTFNNVDVEGVLKVDQIVEKTGAAGITLDGVQLKDGNVVLANGKGIDFSATSQPDVFNISELLNDYEQGEFFAKYAGSAGGEPIDGDKRCWYVKVGNVVHIGGFIQANKNTLSGNITVTGLPFVCADISFAVACAISSYRRWATDMRMTAVINKDHNFITLYKSASNSATATAVTDADMSSISSFYNTLAFNISYRTA